MNAKGIAAGLALLGGLLAGEAEATPITFDMTDALFLTGGVEGSWLIGAPTFDPYSIPPGSWVTLSTTPEVRMFPRQLDYVNLLIAAVSIGPAARDWGSFPFTAIWLLDGEIVKITRQVIPDDGFGPGPFDGSFFAANATIDLSTIISDWSPHHLIVDLSVPNDARQYAFDVLQPTPEPTTLLLVGSGLVLLGWRERRRLLPR